MTGEKMREFKTWAADKGYDTAHTYDTDRSNWIFLNPMTSDLWMTWQAATANATLAERERCALVCEALSINAGRIRAPGGSLEGDTGFECADAIRMPPTGTGGNHV